MTKKTQKKRWTYLDDEVEMSNIRVNIPTEMWQTIKEHARENQRPAGAQLRIFLQQGME